MKRKFWNLILWVWTIVFFVILMPIAWIIQGVFTPFEIIANCIEKKKIIDPEEYWLGFYKNMSNEFCNRYEIIACYCEEEDL